VGCFIIYFSCVFACELAYYWHTVGGFEFCEIRKSLAMQGFFVLVICEGFHCWEEQNVADGCAIGQEHYEAVDAKS
jgi:hypothetical protein